MSQNINKKQKSKDERDTIKKIAKKKVKSKTKSENTPKHTSDKTETDDIEDIVNKRIKYLYRAVQEVNTDIENVSNKNIEPIKTTRTKLSTQENFGHIRAEFSELIIKIAPDLSENSLKAIDKLFEVEKQLQIYGPSVELQGLNLINVICSDITSLEIDCIVLAVNTDSIENMYQSSKSDQIDQNSSGYIDSILNSLVLERAGPRLQRELIEKSNSLIGHKLRTSECTITDSFHLPCQKIIYTHQPKVDKNLSKKIQAEKLCETYQNCLKLAIRNKIKTLAFPCLGKDFPVNVAAQAAIRTVLAYSDKLQKSETKIILCTYNEDDYKIFIETLKSFFKFNPCQK